MSVYLLEKMAIAVVLAFMLLVAPAWSVTDLPTTVPSEDSTMMSAVISSVRVETNGGLLASIFVTFENLEDNPFSYDYDQYGSRFLSDRVDCFANKLVLTNGTATIAPQHPGICNSYEDNTVIIHLDNHDYLEFILAGFASQPFPQLHLYTNDSALEGDFPIESVSQSTPLLVTYVNYPQDFVGIDSATFDAINGVFLIHFSTFVCVSSLNFSQISLASTTLLSLTPINSVNLTNGTILTVADELAIDIAIQLTARDRMELQSRNICLGGILSDDCKMYSSPDLAESFDGLQTFDMRFGSYVRVVPHQMLPPVYLQLTIEYVGYTWEVPLQLYHAYHLQPYGGHYEIVTRVTCYTDGINHMDPELFLNNELIDEQYLTRNWPSEITLTADDGIALEELDGYYSCQTRNNTFNSSNIITQQYDYIFFFEGATVTVNPLDSVVIPFVHNYEFMQEIRDVGRYYSLIMTSGSRKPPSFEYTTNISQTTPFVVEFHIFDIEFSDSGNYSVFIYGQTATKGDRGFTLIVNQTTEPTTETTEPATETTEPATETTEPATERTEPATETTEPTTETTEPATERTEPATETTEPTTETTEPATVTTVTLCMRENDLVWWQPYPNTRAGTTYSQPCPQNGTSTITGSVSRLCLPTGVWDEVDTSDCTRQDFDEAENTAAELFGGNITDINPSEVVALIEKLVDITDNGTTGGSTNFAKDLNTTNNIIGSTVNYLLDTISVTDSDTTLEFNKDIIDVFDNILDESNMDGWQDLQQSQDSAGSQQLLLNAEVYGQYAAASLMSTRVNISNSIELDREHIKLSAQEIDPKSLEDIVFPMDVKASNEIGSAQTTIPAALLEERGALSGNVSTVNILFRNLEMFLPRDSLEKQTTRPVTQVLSSQVLTDLQKLTSFNNQAQFKFTTPKFANDTNATNARCVFWNFAGEVANSTWSTENVTTLNVMEMEEGVFEVHCGSTHFTAFAVLMDVTGALNTTSKGVQFALTVVSYVGCSISILFLLISIIYLLSLRKKLFKKVHNFIHLNLSIALLLGYIVFLAGVDHAAVTRWSCVLVAALLHYLFTAVFFWMLCEGIMLYLMLVVVFSEHLRKWWLFFLLGWIGPIIPVAISVGVINDQYGTDTYCWIAVGNGTRGAIWAFVVPMLLVVIVNVCFLSAALRSVYRQRKMKNNTTGNNSQTTLFKQLFKAMLILLPLLGLTWVFGLLSVNNSTIFFAWIFTILNSLQGLFIFYFHVLRNVKAWNSFTSRIISSTKSNFLPQSSTLGKNSTINSPTVSDQKSKQGFHTSTFDEQIPEEEWAQTPGDKLPLTEKSPSVEVYDPSIAFETDQNMLIDVDETLFEMGDSDDSDSERKGESEKAWSRTVTINWMANKD